MKYLDPLSALVVVRLAVACDTASSCWQEDGSANRAETERSRISTSRVCHFYSENGMYPDGLSKHKKRAVKKKPKSISIELG